MLLSKIIEEYGDLDFNIEDVILKCIPKPTRQELEKKLRGLHEKLKKSLERYFTDNHTMFIIISNVECAIFKTSIGTFLRINIEDGRYDEMSLEEISADIMYYFCDYHFDCDNFEELVSLVLDNSEEIIDEVIYNYLESIEYVDNYQKEWNVQM